MKYAVALAVLLSATAQTSLAQSPDHVATASGTSAAVAALTGHQSGTRPVAMDSVVDQDEVTLQQGETAVHVVSEQLELLLDKRLSSNADTWGPTRNLLVSAN